MKLSWVLLVVIIILLAIAIFTKPGNAYCVEKAKEMITSINQNVPGYNNPLNQEESRGGSDVRIDQILIKDRLFWKEVSYASTSNVKVLGYAYFNKFHPVSEKKAE
ncbi:hypothetical protein [Pollutibacter soli]|uniref:hypothetical protein n=1 Tax=Pollutibacter soli TaxID=3034157 RepID=UPI003013A8DC